MTKTLGQVAFEAHTAKMMLLFDRGDLTSDEANDMAWEAAANAVAAEVRKQADKEAKEGGACPMCWHGLEERLCVDDGSERRLKAALEEKP